MKRDKQLFSITFKRAFLNKMEEQNACDFSVASLNGNEISICNTYGS